MDQLDPRKALVTYCPKLANRRCCWGIKDLSYLGLGTALYLNFMRWMAGTFFVIGLFSVHNAYLNTQGNRYTMQSLVGMPIEYAATNPSIANLGGQNWTAGGDNYCNNHGFAASVCRPDGWGTDGSAWEYACGQAPDEAASVERSLSRFIFGGVTVKCSNTQIQCSCMPGWGGARCDVPSPSNSIGINGWCIPPKTWWNTTDPVSRNDNDDKWARDPSYCSGHGHCQARTSETDITELRYTFCQCDEGYYGETCQNSVSSTDMYGDYYNYAFTAKDASKCNKGTLPAIVREFFQVSFPTANCSRHGFGVRYPLVSANKLYFSNAFRVQTPSVCYCEPGFNGEECLGGEAVPDSQGWIHGACSVILLIVLATLYRERKRMEKIFNVEVMTAADFTVFVNHLPMVKLADIKQVYAHFEQFGSVHTVSPALADNKLIQLQKHKNAVMAKIQILQEMDAHGRKLEAYQRAVKLAKENGDEDRLATLSRPSPVSLPPMNTAVEGEIKDELISSLKGWELTIAKFLVNQPYLLLYGFVPRKFLFKVLLYVNSLINRELAQPQVQSFARCFVTFKTADGRDKCINYYSERRDGMFGKLPEFDPIILYQGKHWITVTTAPEPEEVQWESLAVGPRVRGLLVTTSVIVMIGIIAGLFNLVLVINASKATGIVGLLISLAVLVLNVIVAQLWVDTAGVEQHYYTGASMRSVYLKTLITQIFITVLAGTIGVYGYPIDAKNGYNQDWYLEAGGFVFRMILIESVVPPIMDMVAAPYRLNLYFAKSAVSLSQQKLLRQPIEAILAMRCASLMRTVIMCCAFNAGLPVLNFAVAGGLFIRYHSDKYLYKHLFMVKKSGPELARALELTLMFATAVQVVMGWVTLRAGWESNLITEAIFYIGVIGTLWAILGYFSYRWFRGRDCWCGSGPIIPCVGWLCCFSDRILSPFQTIHQGYMVIVFGVDFFHTLEDKRRGGDSSGMPYDIVMRSHGLRRIPYYIYERGQLFPELMSEERLPESMNGPQLLAKLDADKRQRKFGTEKVDFIESPLLQLQKTEKLKEIAANKANAMGVSSKNVLAGVGKF